MRFFTKTYCGGEIFSPHFRVVQNDLIKWLSKVDNNVNLSMSKHVSLFAFAQLVHSFGETTVFQEVLAQTLQLAV